MELMDLSNYTIVELAEHALRKPDDFGYWGDKEMFVTWGFTGHDETGIRDILQSANFKGITDHLMFAYPRQFRIEEYKHWACGSVKRLVCKILIDEKDGIVERNITDAFKAAMKIHERLNDYPVYDEDIFYGFFGEEQVKIITEAPRYLLNMVDEEDAFWVDKIINKLDDMGIYIDPISEVYPTDNEFLTAVYECELWNQDSINLWEEWCYENEKEYPPKKKNTNQLDLF
jgi:hypothetical protein